MTRSPEKTRRMELRRANGTRSFGHPTEGLSPTSGLGYLVAHACFECRSTFKKPLASAVDQPGFTCPRCKATLHQMGRSFRAPAKNDLDGWKKVQALFSYGFRFFSYRSFERCPRLPERFKEVEAFVRGNPKHPFRIAEPNHALHPDALTRAGERRR